MTPEEKARQQIDARLVAAGWIVQDYQAFNPSVGRGIALREVPLKSGTCDYLLLVDCKAMGVVEELAAVVSVNLQRATRLRQSILQKAFAGNL